PKSLFQHSPADSKNQLESNLKTCFRQAAQTKPTLSHRIFRPRHNLRIVRIERMPYPKNTKKQNNPNQPYEKTIP
ncbi:MAG: hypothetical protein K2I38_05035, partial [Duncaniella sp.]|nr:hypothetical protein [Duncaniella sp.]